MANDVITFGQDSEIAFNYSNKTDIGLTIGYTVELESDATPSASYIDESLLSISDGFGKIVLGSNNGVADNYVIEAEDAVVKESTPTVVNASIGTDTDISISSNDNNKVAYYLPPMDGFTAGASTSLFIFVYNCIS